MEKGNSDKNTNLDIRERSFNFAVRVIFLCKDLTKDETNRILCRQIIRSATSIGANLEEAKGARTRPDFTNRTNIAKKEARETYYWLRLIRAVNNDSLKAKTENLFQESNELVSILTKSIHTLQNYEKNEHQTS